MADDDAPPRESDDDELGPDYEDYEDFGYQPVRGQYGINGAAANPLAVPEDTRGGPAVDPDDPLLRHNYEERFYGPRSSSERKRGHASDVRAGPRVDDFERAVGRDLAIQDATAAGRLSNSIFRAFDEAAVRDGDLLTPRQLDDVTNAVERYLTDTISNSKPGKQERIITEQDVRRICELIQLDSVRECMNDIKRKKEGREGTGLINRWDCALRNRTDIYDQDTRTRASRKTTRRDKIVPNRVFRKLDGDCRPEGPPPKPMVVYTAYYAVALLKNPKGLGIDGKKVALIYPDLTEVGASLLERDCLLACKHAFYLWGKWMRPSAYLNGKDALKSDNRWYRGLRGLQREASQSYKIPAEKLSRDWIIALDQPTGKLSGMMYFSELEGHWLVHGSVIASQDALADLIGELGTAKPVYIRITEGGGVDQLLQRNGFDKTGTSRSFSDGPPLVEFVPRTKYVIPGPVTRSMVRLGPLRANGPAERKHNPSGAESTVRNIPSKDIAGWLNFDGAAFMSRAGKTAVSTWNGMYDPEGTLYVLWAWSPDPKGGVTHDAVKEMRLFTEININTHGLLVCPADRIWTTRQKDAVVAEVQDADLGGAVSWERTEYDAVKMSRWTPAKLVVAHVVSSFDHMKSLNGVMWTVLVLRNLVTLCTRPRSKDDADFAISVSLPFALDDWMLDDVSPDGLDPDERIRGELSNLDAYLDVSNQKLPQIFLDADHSLGYLVQNGIFWCDAWVRNSNNEQAVSQILRGNGIAAFVEVSNEPCGTTVLWLTRGAPIHWDKWKDNTRFKSPKWMKPFDDPLELRATVPVMKSKEHAADAGRWAPYNGQWYRVSDAAKYAARGYDPGIPEMAARELLIFGPLAWTTSFSGIIRPTFRSEAASKLSFVDTAFQPHTARGVQPKEYKGAAGTYPVSGVHSRHNDDSDCDKLLREAVDPDRPDDRESTRAIVHALRVRQTAEYNVRKYGVDPITARARAPGEVKAKDAAMTEEEKRDRDTAYFDAMQRNWGAVMTHPPPDMNVRVILCRLSDQAVLALANRVIEHLKPPE